MPPAEAAEHRPDANYLTFDLGDIPYREPGLFHQVLEEIRELFDTGQLQPPPHTVFPFQDAVAAYRYMQQARHIGKVVLSLGADRAPVRPVASYLVTGGLGALGLAVSRHLVELGARHLVLAGRSAPSPAAADAIRDLAASGATVTAVKADTAQADDVATLIATCQELAPLRGIVHAAGVIEDAILPNQSPEALARVMAPKVAGAWQLHRQTETLGLDFFVLFSSMASLTGSPGQANYSAGNAFIDALAHQRQANGLAGLSIDWGPWAQIGMAARLDRADLGVGNLEPETGLEILTELLQSSTRGSVAQVGVMRLDWNVFQNRLTPTQRETFFSGLLRRSAAVAETRQDDFLRRLVGADEDGRRAMLYGFVNEQLIRVLGLAGGQDISPTRSWRDFGLDSLMVVELKNRLERALGIVLPLELLAQDAITSESVTAYVLDKLGDIAVDGPEPDDQAPATSEFVELYERVRAIPQAFATVAAQRGRQVLIDGRWRTDFASCNYLGFDLDPEVMAAIAPAVETWGVHPSWTRAVASPQLYAGLERTLADLVGAPDTLVFPSITLLHLGVLPVLAGPDGVILKDVAAHHSIHEACLRAQADGTEWLDFRHNDLDDLARKLARYPAGRPKIIATDGAYSMGSEHPPLIEYARLAKLHHGLVYIDDAHGFGILGERPDSTLPYGYGGNGIVKHIGLDYAADRIVYVAGMSKAFSSYAAFVTCFDEAVKARLQASGPYVFSGPTSVASLASALAGLRLNQTDGDARRMRILGLTRRLVTTARQLGFEVDNAADFPVVSVVIGEWPAMLRACQVLWEHDILITPAIFPAVPINHNLVRFSVTAANTPAEIEQALEALEAVRTAIAGSSTSADVGGCSK